MSGYFKIWRDLFNKPIWLNSTPEQKTILISIIKMANWTENSWEWNKKTYHCKAGEFITSYSKICETCGKGVTHQNVRTALKRFQNLEFLTYQTTVGEYGGIKVIITNWDKYQNEINTSTNTSLTHHQHIANTSLTIIEKDKNIRNKKNNISFDFDEFFSNYPRKESKQEAIKSFEKALKDGVMLDKILDGVKRYKKFVEEKKIERRFIKLPTTWLNQGCWDDDYGESVENAPKIVPLFIDENASYQSIEASGDLFFLTSYANLSGFKYQSSRDEADRIFENTRSAKRVDEYCRKVLGWGYNEQTG